MIKFFYNEDVLTVLPAESVEQIKWERDTAIKQLESHGIPFCGE